MDMEKLFIKVEARELH